MSKRAEYQKYMQEEIEAWTARLDALATKSKDAVKTLVHKQLDDWRTASEAAKAKLAELRDSSGDKWDVIKKDLDTLWRGLASVLDQTGPAESPPEAAAPPPPPAAPPAPAAEKQA